MLVIHALYSWCILTLSSAFKSSKYAYRALYVIAGFEVVVNIGVSWYWKVLSFKGTHLIERMTLLTLYICNAFTPSVFISLLTSPKVGEGVIEVLKSVAKVNHFPDSTGAQLTPFQISQAQDSWSPGNIGTLSGAIASIVGLTVHHACFGVAQLTDVA